MDVTVLSPATRRARTRQRLELPRGSEVATLGGIGAVLVVVAWWAGASPATGPGARLTDAGRLTGLLAGYAAMCQLLLRSRVPLLERRLGTDGINAAHRVLGTYLVLLLLGHVGFVTAGYAAASGTSLPDQLWTLVTSYPYVSWAAIGFVLLLAPAVTSVRRIRRRLRYEQWHGIHLLAYVALTLAFFHQVTDGDHLRQSPALRLAWIVAAVAVAATVVGSRFLRPICVFARHRIVVLSVDREGAGVVSVTMTGRRLDRLVRPGQYCRWRFLTRGLAWTAHPWSISAEPHPDRLRITARVVGDHSARLLDLRPGTRVVAEGPSGGLVAPGGVERPMVLVAGGIGVTPLRALLATVPCPPGRLDLVYRAHDESQVILRKELDALAAARPARVHYLVGPRTSEAAALTSPRLRQLCPAIADSAVFVCGSAAFVAHVRGVLAEVDVPRARIRSESFELS